MYTIGTGVGNSTAAAKRPTVGYLPTSVTEAMQKQGTASNYGVVGSGKVDTSQASYASGSANNNSTGSSGSATAGNTADASAAQAAQAAQAMRDYYASILAAQQQARNSAYDRTIQQQQANYAYNAGQVNSAADSALKQAYINRMMNQKNMPQALTAQGLSGGASESTLGSLLNAYSNSRNNIETNRAGNLTSLANTLANNISSAANTRDTGAANDLSTFNSNLLTLAASNPTLLTTLKQGASLPVTSYANNQMASNGNSTESALTSALQNAGITGDALQAYLTRLGY